MHTSLPRLFAIAALASTVACGPGIIGSGSDVDAADLGSSTTADGGNTTGTAVTAGTTGAVGTTTTGASTGGTSATTTTSGTNTTTGGTTTTTGGTTTTTTTGGTGGTACGVDTWNNFVHAQFQTNCSSGCHSFTGTYSGVKGRSGQVSSMVSNGQMPPSGPLDAALRDRIVRWIDCGLPQ